MVFFGVKLSVWLLSADGGGALSAGLSVWLFSIDDNMALELLKEIVMIFRIPVPCFYSNSQHRGLGALLNFFGCKL